LTASSCGVVNNILGRFGGGEEAPEEGGTIALPEEESAETFEDPMLPGLPSAAEIASAELISSTRPSERLQEIRRTRSDPFALVPVPPPPQVTPPPATTGGGGGGGGGGATPTANGGGGGQTPGGGGGPSPIAPLPALPQATAALGVTVSGIVQINGERYAIVDAPGEPTSRYVRPGDRLGGGRILVKRIDTRPGSEPVVILEENGVEVARPVGGVPANSPTEEAPTADLPALPLGFASAG
jgi:hypothetical protein